MSVTGILLIIIDTHQSVSRGVASLKQLQVSYVRHVVAGQSVAMLRLLRIRIATKEFEINSPQP